MPQPIQPINANQEKFIRMAARGCSRKEILLEAFGVDLDTATEKEIHSADCKMSRLRKRPEYMEIWKDEIKHILVGATADAVKVLKGQIHDEKQPWLANKAANDVINHGKSMIFGEEERAVNVRVTGMPDLGSPDQPEEDG